MKSSFSKFLCEKGILTICYSKYKSAIQNRPLHLYPLPFIFHPTIYVYFSITYIIKNVTQYSHISGLTKIQCEDYKDKIYKKCLITKILRIIF